MSIDSRELTIIKTSTPKDIIPKEELKFGQSFTDHMLEIEWDQETGWAPPTISPYHSLAMDPATSVLHYAFELFEGMKAYLDADDNVRLFRPDQNMIRMNRSAKRGSLPQFDGEELIKCMEEFLKVDKRFIPKGEGYSLYLRPTLISTHVGLGVSPPTKALLFVIASPVGPYFNAGLKPVSLEATSHSVRAWPKGVGLYKLGANYVLCIEPQVEAAKRGHQQNLWLFGEEGFITEVGAMNVFFVFKKGDQFELVTAPLDGTILPGVTRDSTLRLAKTRLSSNWSVNERPVTIYEVRDRAKLGEVVEAFGTGTAAIVSSINNIEFEGEQIAIPCGDGRAGELTQKICDWIQGIQYGREEFEDWSRVV